MAEATERQSQIATELPTKYLPGVEYRDLPEPAGLRKYIGASVILLATALGSGELIIWPSITARVGIGLLWLAVLGVTMQYFLNMEIERYTLATGETAVTGFSRLWKPWGIIFVLGAILPNAWPGWASSGATEFTFIFGLTSSSVPIIAAIFLTAIGISVTVSPVIYQLLEKVQGVMVVIIIIFIGFAIVVATDASAWTGIITKAPSSIPAFPGYFRQLGAASLLGAIAFAGAGGANNLVQSNYVRDKGMGMGILIPNIVSPITGEEVAAPSLGYMFQETEENKRRWKGWWKVANQEQLITFWFLGTLLLVALSVLVFSTIGGGNVLPGDLSFVQDEGNQLGQSIGSWFETFFFVAGFVMLFSTNLGVLDYVARLTGDSLKVSYLGNSEFWSESKIYITVIWAMIIAGITILFAGLSQPLILLVIASAGGGVVMAFYSVMLIVLNRKVLPDVAKLKGWRVPIMVFIAIFFVIFSLILVYSQISGLFG